MNGKQAVRASMGISNYVLDAYIADLSDADLMTRPGAGCNHLAWQLGHLIVSQADIMNALKPGAAPRLPPGFREKHATEHAGSNDPAAFAAKAEYAALLSEQRQAAEALLDQTTDEDFDRPAPEAFRRMFPTTGHLWMLIATHPLMHSGQFVPVRRMLGKPVVI
jgi:uncharacterized damage-inducible protein DinB